MNRKRKQRPERLWDILLRVFGGRRFLVDTGRYETLMRGIDEETDNEFFSRRPKNRLPIEQSLTYNQKRRQDHE